MTIGLGVMAAGGGAAGPELPLKYSPCWMAHTILIADARTLEVLFWNSRTFFREDATDAEALKGKFHELVADLAEVRKDR